MLLVLKTWWFSLKTLAIMQLTNHMFVCLGFLLFDMNLMVLSGGSGSKPNNDRVCMTVGWKDDVTREGKW